MAACSWYDWGCMAAQHIANDGIDAIVGMIQEGAGNAFAALGTMWVHIPTPTVTGNGGSAGVDASKAPGASSFETLLGNISWVSLIVAALSLIGMFAVWGYQHRHGAEPNLNRAGAILTGVVVISSASGLVTKLMPTEGSDHASGPVAFLQHATWWIAGGMAVISLMIGGARMAWQQRYDSGRDLISSILTMIIVAGGGLGIIGTISTVGDGWSTWILQEATDRDFGANILLLLGTAGTSTVGQLALLVLGFISVIVAFAQIALMVVRGALIVVLAGGLPVAVSFTAMPSGRAFAGKYVGWLIGFLVYKPAAAFVYAAAFQLIGTHMYEDDDTGLLQMISGIALLIMAIVALPAILRLVVPAAGAVGGGALTGMAVAGAGAALGKGAEMATGAIKKHAAKGSSSGGGGDTGSGDGGDESSPTGANSSGGGKSSSPASSSSPAPSGSGAGGSGGGEAGGGTPSTGSGTAGSTSTSTPAASGAASGATGSGGAAATGAAGAGGGAAAGGAAGGGAAASGAAAGAAAGPVGIAAGAAVGVAKKVGKAAHGAAVAAVDDSVGSGQ